MHVPVRGIVELRAGGGRSPRGGAGKERDGADRALAAAALADVRHLGPQLLRPEAELGPHRVHHFPLDLHHIVESLRPIRGLLPHFPGLDRRTPI